MKIAVRIVCAAAALGFAASAHAQFVVERKWSFNHATANGTVTPPTGRSSEIVEFDPLTRSLFTIGGNGIDVLGLDGTLRSSLLTSALGSVNSIAIRGDVAAVAFSNPTVVTDPGTVRFFRTTDFTSGGTPVSFGTITVGATPDMVTWTPDGRLLVANEGERQSNTNNPVGSVSIIGFGPGPVSSASVQAAIAANTASVTTAGFDGVPLVGDVRLQPGVSATVGLEPEYIALNADGTRALVTLQEANAVGILNLVTQKFDSVVALGLKSYGPGGPMLDPSDRDGPGGTNAFSTATLRNGAIKGMYMPDGIASFVKDGKTYYVTANEGDFLVDDADRVRIADLPADRLDPAVFGDIATFRSAANFGRLRVSNLELPATGLISELRMTGTRSFAIWDEDGKLVSDSGDMIERMLALIAPQLYDDNRSPDKGVEPEGVAVKQVGDRIYAFIGLERTLRSVVAVFDVTDPANPKFVQFIIGNAGERAVEGVLLFEDGGQLYLALAQEEPSNFTTLYALTEVPEPSTYALLAAGLVLLGFAARRRRAA
jgi:hypothetical protein